VQLFFGLGDWIVYNGAVWQRVEGGSDGNFANVTLTSTDAGATASPLLELYRDSASPAASDTLGEIEFNGEDSAGNKQAYALFHASILSPTSGSEQGQLHFETATAGALTEKMIIGTTNLVINEIGAVFNVRIEGDTDANLFYTDATNSRVGVGTISPTQKLDVAGSINLTGNVIVASGQGIDFSATPGTGTSELLADYEEGTWTPSLTASTSGTITVGGVTGTYTKIGRVVTVEAYIPVSSVSLPVGNLVLNGLPFTKANNNNNAMSIWGGGFTASAITALIGFVVANSTTAFIQTYSAGNNGALASYVQAGTEIRITVSYQV